jgi:diaminopimelate epimerase
MQIDFLKMQGCGDDTLLLDCLKQPAPEEPRRPDLARRMLDRVRGVGGASLILLDREESGRLRADCYGPAGEACPPGGNALRCVGRYASDSGAVTAERFPVETGATAVMLQIIDSLNVRVDMGVPVGGPHMREIRDETEEGLTFSLDLGSRTMAVTPVSVGSLFGVAFVTDFSFPFLKTCKTVSGCRGFPAGAGIAFTQVITREELRLRAWQGGAEAPASCPAAGAALVASVVSGFMDREAFVHLGGGEIFVQWDESGNRLYQTGAAGYVFTGTFDFEEE